MVLPQDLLGRLKLLAGQVRNLEHDVSMEELLRFVRRIGVVKHDHDIHIRRCRQGSIIGEPIDRAMEKRASEPRDAAAIFPHPPASHIFRVFDVQVHL